ncbi:MAG: Transporter, LysE family, partial [uncultured Acetobacteraceae bacterium]
AVRHVPRLAVVRFRHLRHAGAEQPDAAGVRGELRAAADGAAPAGRRPGLRGDGGARRAGARAGAGGLAAGLHGDEGGGRGLPALARLEAGRRRRGAAGGGRRRRAARAADDLPRRGGVPVGQSEGLGDGGDGHGHLLRAGPLHRERVAGGAGVRRRRVAGERIVGGVRGVAAALAGGAADRAGVQRVDGGAAGAVVVAVGGGGMAV